jgi:CDP-diacylglycerol--serine O-phosphatidyltransferase
VCGDEPFVVRGAERWRTNILIPLYTDISWALSFLGLGGGRVRHQGHLVRGTVPPMHPAGRPFVLAGIAATLLLCRARKPLAVASVLATAATAAFFRAPKRVPPTGPNLVLAAADGLVSLIEDAVPPPELGLPATPRQRVSVYLSVFDVHVQRAPATGVVERVAYRPGKFFAAVLDEASSDNERNSLLLRTENGQELIVVQIAGLIARRIVCDVVAGDTVSAGGAFGLIRFGSRVDVYLAPGSRVLVEKGQRTVGGETQIAALPAPPGSLAAAEKEQHTASGETQIAALPALPGSRVLPIAITLLVLCAGLKAMQFALTRRYGLAIGAIGVAAILDGLDGRIARLLDATSKMGAELDSLCDGISFGVSPALLLYVWRPGDARIGWVVPLGFAVCMVLRLARFTALLEDTQRPPYAAEFFAGVPAPVGGLLALLPLMLDLGYGNGWWSSPAVVWAWTGGIAVLLVSRLPTLSLKQVRIPAKAIPWLLAGVCLLAAAIIRYPLAALVIALLYLAHIPYAVHRQRWLGQHPEAWPTGRRAIRGIRGPQPTVAPPGAHRPARGAPLSSADTLQGRRPTANNVALFAWSALASWTMPVSPSADLPARPCRAAFCMARASVVSSCTRMLTARSSAFRSGGRVASANTTRPNFRVMAIRSSDRGQPYMARSSGPSVARTSSIMIFTPALVSGAAQDGLNGPVRTTLTMRRAATEYVN